MQIRVFNISIHTNFDEQEELNKFLRSHRVIEVRQQYDETRGLWSFAVNYLEHNGSGNASSPSIQQSGDKVDYRTVLSPEVFSVFSKLREARKQIAKDESVPAYAIFTNRELAMIAELPELSIQGMMKIDGINKGRAEKYGIALIRAFDEAPENTDETQGMGD